MEFVKTLRDVTISYADKAAAKAAEIRALDSDRNNYAQSTYMDKRRVLVKEQEDILIEGRRSILDIVDTYKQQLKERYQAKGSAVTDDAKLLDGQIPLTPGDLEALVDKYTQADNMTMLRMIFEYTHKNDIHIDRAFYTEETRAQTADALGETMCGALTSDMTAALVKKDDFFWSNMVADALKGE